MQNNNSRWESMSGLKHSHTKEIVWKHGPSSFELHSKSSGMLKQRVVVGRRCNNNIFYIRNDRWNLFSCRLLAVDGVIKALAPPDLHRIKIQLFKHLYKHKV